MSRQSDISQVINTMLKSCQTLSEPSLCLHVYAMRGDVTEIYF